MSDIVLKVPAEPVATIIRVSEPGGADTEYVDAGDARTLAEAKEYTDDHVVPVGYIDDGDEQTLLDAKGYADQVYRDLGTEIDSLTPTISRIDQTSSHNEYRILELKGQVDNLPAADVTKAYVDTGLSGKADTSQGVPTGGTTGQVLAKTSGSNYATGWVTPTGGSSGLTGPGRPDVPTGTGLADEIAAAPVGTLYNSTDGAGAGAWAWRKRPTGWVVVDGDTGLRRFVLTGGAFPANASYVEYRRRQDAVSFQINSTNAGAWRINAIPSGGTVGVLSAQPGFRPSSGAMAELNSDGRARLGAFLMQLPPNDGGGALQIRPFETIAPNPWVRVPLMTWLTLDGWPTTLPGTPV